MEKKTVRLKCSNPDCKKESTVEVNVFTDDEIQQSIDPKGEQLELNIAETVICKYCGEENFLNRIDGEFQ
jgi:hypothetical protein